MVLSNSKISLELSNQNLLESPSPEVDSVRPTTPKIRRGDRGEVDPQPFHDELDAGLLLADKDHEAAERTVIGWYHKRDLARMSDLYGLGVLVSRQSQGV